MSWLRRFWRRGKLEQDLAKELQFHIAERTSALQADGLSEEEARRRVRQEFGGIEQVKEECRDARGFSFLESVQQDLRYAFRGMRRSPLFTLIALAALALTTGTVSTVLTLTNTFFLRYLSAERPEQLVAAGIGLAAMGERLIRHLLLGSASADVFFYSGAALLVVFTALFACWIPARRATSVEPLVALRQD